MAPGCRLVVTVPGGPINAFYRHIGHRTHYTAGALKTLLNEARFEVEFTSGVGFPFLNAYLAALAWRGDKVLKDVTGEPGITLRTASVIFNALFYLNSMRRGWQIVALAHRPGNSLSTE